MKSIITKFKKKPLFPRKLDNSILDKLVKFIDTDTGNVTYIQPQFSQVETDISKEKGTDKTDNDFENLGEVELKLKQTSLKDCEIIHFENEEDLFKQVVLFIQRSTKNYLAIAKDDPLDFVTAKASDSLFDKYHRGGVTSLICNSTFKTNHSHIGLHNINTNTDIIKALKKQIKTKSPYDYALSNSKTNSILKNDNVYSFKKNIINSIREITDELVKVGLLKKN